MSEPAPFGRWPPNAHASHKQASVAAALAVPLVYVTYAALFRRRRRLHTPTGFAAFLKETPATAAANSTGA